MVPERVRRDHLVHVPGGHGGLQRLVDDRRAVRIEDERLGVLGALGVGVDELLGGVLELDAGQRLGQIQ